MNENDDVFGLTEDRVVERLLDRLNEGVVPATAAREGEAEEMLREYTELIGLIPFDLEPMAPADGAKERLLQTIQGVEPAMPSEPPPVDLPPNVVAMPVSPWLKRALPLAASLAIVLLGVVGWQSFQISEQGGAIVELTDHLSRVNVDRTTELAEYENHLERMQDQLALVTSKGVEVCTLHAKAAQAADTGARGTLFVAADHQRWYLRIDDLEPCPQGRSYQLWFVMADGSARDGGILEIEHGVELEVTSGTMPTGTVAVNVTLEPAGGSEAPSGPSILYGDEVMRIL